MSRLKLQPARSPGPTSTQTAGTDAGRRRPRTRTDTRQDQPPPSRTGRARPEPGNRMAPATGKGPRQRPGAGRGPADPLPEARARTAFVRAPAGQPGGAPHPDGERLNKYLAAQGTCSRREADDWISRGWIHINGEPAQMGQRVQPGDRVEVRKEAARQQQEQVTILLHKPVGYVSGQAEKGYQPAVVLISEQSRWAEDTLPRRFDRRQLRGLAVAGRLDIDSVGLLVLTQDGRIARQLIGEDSSISKEYLVRVRYGSIERDVQSAFPASKLELLRHGLSLDGKALKPAEVSWQNPEQLRFVLREGRHRQIRRMCELVGLSVTGLKRIRVGQIRLGNLPAGQWRYLRPDEHFS